MAAARDNHYVPQWYQRGFQNIGEPRLFYLDLTPETRRLPDGSTISMNSIHRWGTEQCFFQKDLYSTHVGSALNDEVERLLFGSIDTRGARAVRAFAEGDATQIHRYFQDFFEYLDAQKLRTPKGLDWIRSLYPSLNQIELMREMQALRFRHCTLWTEGIREIVSADSSELKFIATDHPVTIYNASLPPESTLCQYPGDPSIELLGTQTIFALNANTCIILTHLEYAQSPSSVDLVAPRTNVRYRSQSLVSTNAFIRTRRLDRKGVASINFLLKSRARRYIASAQKEGLFPEQEVFGAWSSIGAVLLPTDELWRFGGETYVGFNDGTSHYQDAFGRTNKAHLYLKKEVEGIVSSESPCRCGSGRKFKDCCRGVPAAKRPAWDVYGIRERNIMLCLAIQDVLGITNGKTWDQVRRDISDDQVSEIHKAFASLWPADTNLYDLLPPPSKKRLRCVYYGFSDPRTVSLAVIGWLPYFDEIVVAMPFVNPQFVSPEYNPIKAPAQHKTQTLKNVLMVLALESYIRQGRVHLIPDPGDVNSDFATTVRRMATERTRTWRPSDEAVKRFEAFTRDDYNRTFRRLPEESLRRQICDLAPNAPDDMVRQMVVHFKSRLAGDPFSPLQPLVLGESGAELTSYKGFSLEVALFIAALTGSIIYTEDLANWQQLHDHASRRGAADPATASSVSEELSEVEWPIFLDEAKISRAVGVKSFREIRTTMRKLVGLIRKPAVPVPTIYKTIKRLRNACRRATTGLVHAPQAEVSRAHLTLSAPEGGFMTDEVQRLMLTFGRDGRLNPIPCALRMEFDRPLLQTDM